MPTGDQSLEDVIRAAVEAAVARIFTGTVGKVDSYDASTQRANITPQIRRVIYTAEGEPTTEALPMLRDVRVLHPGGEDWAMHIPLKAGDTVLLLPQQWDPTAWQSTGQLSNPRDSRTHHLAHCVALAGYRQDSKPIPGASSDFPTWQHKDGFKVTLKASTLEVDGASDAAALASKVNQALTDIALAFSTYIPGTGGSSFPDVFVWADTTASSKLKVGG
jgi:hypothetical protein